MRTICFLIGLFFFITILNASVKAQNLQLNNKEEQITIQEFKGLGYTTTLDFEYKSVKKDFWRFCNDFVKLENMRKYYVVSIPPTDEANAELKIWVALLPVKSGTQMKALLNPEKMDAQTRAKNRSAADNLIREFKIFFYQKWIQDNIETIEKENTRLSKKEVKLKQRVNKANAKDNSAKAAQIQRELQIVINDLSQGLAKVEKYKSKLAEVK